MVFKWKCIFVTEQSYYGLFMVSWINSKPDLKQYTAESGGREEGWRGLGCPFTCWWRRRTGKRRVYLPFCPRVFCLGQVLHARHQQWASPVKQEQLSRSVEGDGRSWSRGPGSTGGGYQVQPGRCSLCLPGLETCCPESPRATATPGCNSVWWRKLYKQQRLWTGD